jgi:hypothetical protein
VVLDFLQPGIQTALLYHLEHVWAATSARSEEQLHAHLESALQKFKVKNTAQLYSYSAENFDKKCWAFNSKLDN